MLTQIRGRQSEWTDDIWKEWNTRVQPRLDEREVTARWANYYTPRPAVDEYNRGSDHYGFTYTVGREVWVCQWYEGE